MQCTYCHSQHTVKNGISITGKQKYKCNTCDRQFVLDPAKFPIPDETKRLIDRLLLERISLAGIARVTGVSERWLQYYVNDKYEKVPRQVMVKKRVALKVSGNRCRLFIGNARSAIRISGALMKPCCHPNAIGQSANNPDKPITLNVLIVPLGNGSHAS